MERVKLNINNKQKNIIIMILIVAANFILFLLLNNMTGYVADDYIYFFKYYKHTVTPGLTRVQSISDIIAGMKNHYLYCNGRIPAHFLLQFFLMFGKSIFNFFNSVFFIALGLLVYYHAKISQKKVKPYLLIFIFASLWLAFDKFGVTFLWYSAAFNYLWTTVMILTFLLPFRIYANRVQIPNESNMPNESKGKEILKSAAMIIPGILAGWSNENMGGAVILAVLLYLAYYKYKKIKIKPWHISSLFCAAAGFGMIVFSPSNHVRLGKTKGDTDFFTRLPWAISNILTLTWKPLLIFAIVLILIFSASKFYGKDKKSNDYFLPLVYFISGLAGAFVMIFSPEEPARSFVGPAVFMLIAAFILFTELEEKFTNVEKNKAFKKATSFACVALVCAFGVIYVSNYRGFQLDQSDYNTAQKYVIDQKGKGIKTIKLKNDRRLKNERDSSSQFLVYKYSKNLIHNPSNSKWLDSWMSLYYGVDSISVHGTGKNGR